MPRPAPVRERILDAAQALVLSRGFAATTVDAVIDASSSSKGAFFHHFPSKAALGHALVARYAAADAAILDEFMGAAEAASDDPAEQLVDLVRRFEVAASESAIEQPGCLFVSFIYERGPDDGIDELIEGSILHWRRRILAKLEAATAQRPPTVTADLDSLADHVFTVFEGGFVLARATGDAHRLATQLAHLRLYLALVLGVDPDR